MGVPFLIEQIDNNVFLANIFNPVKKILFFYG